MFLLLALRAVEITFSGAGLHVDEAQYWIWSQDLQWGYYSKPPLLAAMIRGSTVLWGETILGVRLLPMLCWIMASAGLWHLGAVLGQPRAGLLAAGLLAATPASGLLGLVATTDAPLVLGWVATMTLAVKALQTGRWSWWAACGAVVGLSILAKYTAAALAVSLVALPFVSPRPHRRRVWLGLSIASVTALLIVLPHLIWNVRNDWPTLHHTLEITIGQSAAKPAASADTLTRLGQAISRSIEFLSAQLLLLGPAVWLLGFQIIARTRASTHRSGKSCAHPTGQTRGMDDSLNPARLSQSDDRGSFDQARRIGWLFSMPLLALVTLQAASSKAQINWAAPALAPICLLLALAASRRAIPGRAVMGYCVCGVLFSALVALGGDFRQWVGRPAGPGQSEWDIWSRMKGWHETLGALEPALKPLRDLPWATSDRTIHAQVAFELKHLRPMLLSWNPEGGIRHHFDWKQSLSKNIAPAAILYIHGGAPDPALLALYPQAERIAEAASGRVRLEVWRLTRN
jgi:4-amino-4-deoxy-L-arabinose transferase-like glycosyltransferase